MAAGLFYVYTEAISTSWRDRMVAPALRRERRVSGFRNATSS